MALFLPFHLSTLSIRNLGMVSKAEFSASHLSPSQLACAFRMGFGSTMGGCCNKKIITYADKLKWAYNHNTSNQVQHHFHPISLKYSDSTFARNLLWNLGCFQCCEYTARLAYKKLTFPVGWSLSQPVLWLSYCYNSVWLNKINCLKPLVIPS